MEEQIKKRGRKPKKTTIDEIENDDNIPKKRGRKPKEKSYSVSKPIVSQMENINEHIILHLPITIKDLEINCPDVVINAEEQKKEPEPYDPNNNFDEYEEESHTNEHHGGTIIYVKDKEIIQIDDTVEKKLVKRNILNIMYEFINNKDKGWTTKTDVWCFWCMHQFDCQPCAIPIKYVKGTFYLYGNFCSFNCAASYIFNNPSYNTWERYSLLNLLYKKLYDTSYIKIKLAPARETLKVFGGFLSIDEFRSNFLTLRTYNLIHPPMISIIPKIEENIFENKMNTEINYDKIEKEKSGVSGYGGSMLKLKRDKPVNEPHATLESFMDLKIT